MRDELDVLVIGAGQAGLATAYWLLRQSPQLEVAVVDRSARVGQSWRDRWDSLRLFTPRAYSSLPGLPFPAGPGESPDRLEMADYLEAYAAAFGLPVHLGVDVGEVCHGGDGFRAVTSTGPLSARHVVVAGGPFHDAHVPPAADRLGAGVQQLHSDGYRRPTDVVGPRVAVVGGGNSAAQLALELSSTAQVTWVTPGRPRQVPAHVLGVTSYRWLSLLGILHADAGGLVARTLRKRGDPVFGRELVGPLRRRELALRTSRVVGSAQDRLLLQDGTSLPTDTVLWCTGYHPRYPWLRVPGALDDAGNPRHEHGASPVRGLHWMGLPWQSTLASAIIPGVDADARGCVRRILG